VIETSADRNGCRRSHVAVVLAAIASLLLWASACGTGRGGFAIYRVADPSATSPETAGDRIQELTLEPAPVLTTADIVRYSRSARSFELREGVTSRFAEDNGRFFVAMVGDERVFVAGYLSPWSSLGYLGTTLRVFPGSPRLLKVTAVPRDSPVPDPMDDPRIQAALRAAGVLSE
jgi:hypothetical protein